MREDIACSSTVSKSADSDGDGGSGVEAANDKSGWQLPAAGSADDGGKGAKAAGSAGDGVRAATLSADCSLSVSAVMFKGDDEGRLKGEGVALEVTDKSLLLNGVKG